MHFLIWSNILILFIFFIMGVQLSLFCVAPEFKKTYDLHYHCVNPPNESFIDAGLAYKEKNGIYPHDFYEQLMIIYRTEGNPILIHEPQKIILISVVIFSVLYCGVPIFLTRDALRWWRDPNFSSSDLIVYSIFCSTFFIGANILMGYQDSYLSKYSIVDKAHLLWYVDQQNFGPRYLWHHSIGEKFCTEFLLSANFMLIVHLTSLAITGVCGLTNLFLILIEIYQII